MSILSTIFGNGVAKPIEEVGNVLDKLFTSDDERLTHAEMKERLRQQPMIAQQTQNNTEAKQPGNFKGGWRPYIGWVLGTSLGCFAIPYYLVCTYIWAKICLSTNTIVPYPGNTTFLFELITGMLGMAAIRSFDKLKGTSQ